MQKTTEYSEKILPIRLGGWRGGGGCVLVFLQGEDKNGLPTAQQAEKKRNSLSPSPLAQRDGHGCTRPRHGTPAAQGFTVGANQCRLLQLVGWGGFGVRWVIGDTSSQNLYLFVGLYYNLQSILFLPPPHVIYCMLLEVPKVWSGKRRRGGGGQADDVYFVPSLGGKRVLQ